MMKIGTGLALLMVLLTASCGGDDEEGSGGPLSPSPVAPMDTTSSGAAGQTRMPGIPGIGGDEGIRGAEDGIRLATADKNAIDFSGVNWEWNAKNTHLEPDSFPDARVKAGSNVWRRDNGTGLIRILSDTDLRGMNFSTAGASWPLSQRRVGLYVSEITGAEVDRISAGGGGRGGRADDPLECWAVIEESAMRRSPSGYPARAPSANAMCRHAARSGVARGRRRTMRRAERTTWTPSFSSRSRSQGTCARAHAVSAARNRNSCIST